MHEARVCGVPVLLPAIGAGDDGEDVCSQQVAQTVWQENHAWSDPPETGESKGLVFSIYLDTYYLVSLHNIIK